MFGSRLTLVVKEASDRIKDYSNEKIKFVQDFLKLGADPTGGGTNDPLAIATSAGRIKIVQALIDAGAPVNKDVMDIIKPYISYTCLKCTKSHYDDILECVEILKNNMQNEENQIPSSYTP